MDKKIFEKKLCEVMRITIIGGNGPLSKVIDEKIKKYSENVTLVGWIPHEKLPEYLNELKLLVLPSYTEGLPTIVLEAMACGTPVLATPVGGIPDVIKEGKTGFILENNSPECIAKNVIKILDFKHLHYVAERECNLILKRYTFDYAVNRYSEILNKIRT